MVIPTQEVERFYNIWFPLLHYVNQHKHLLPASSIPANLGVGKVKPADAIQLRDALWEDDSLREMYIAENPHKLSPADLALVESWQYRVKGSFYVTKYLKKYTVFMTDGEPNHAYGVLGLYSPIEEVVGPYPPILVQAVLIPFEGQIIYDGLMQPYPVYFGGGVRSNLREAYRNIQEREGVITTLMPQAALTTAVGGNLEETGNALTARNKKVLTAFQKDLAQSSLSLKMIAQHSETIKHFGESQLLWQDPPRGLLDLEASDIQAYLDSLREKGRKTGAVTSFKRFVRFLWNTGRIYYEREQTLTDFLKHVKN